MTSEQAKKFIAAYPGAKNFVKPSHLEELSPLLECHVEAIVCRKDEFHDISGAFMPRKETLDKFAQACGISYNPTAETTRKEGSSCYVGSAQGMVMGPDGKQILGPICEYEFDVEVRLEELKLKGKTAWNNGSKSTRAYTEQELASERIQLLKVGRMRANTGARSRATIAILGMQTGFKNLFDKNASDHTTITFLFSRIIVNAKNEMVLNRMLDNIAGPTQALFGPAPVAAISGRTDTAEPHMRNATPASDDFDDFPADPPAADERVTRLVAAISEWTLCEDQRIAKRAQAILDRGESNPDVLEPSLALLSYLGNGGRTGANVCIQALDDAPDVAYLKSLVEKVNKAKAS